jgi:hypothetical protein
MPSPKRTLTRRTGRERIGTRIGKLEKTLGEIKALVDVHCGEQVVQTARAAAIAAADEVLTATGLTPAPFTPGPPTNGSSNLSAVAPGVQTPGAFVPGVQTPGAFVPGVQTPGALTAALAVQTPGPLSAVRTRKTRKAKQQDAVANRAAAEFNALAALSTARPTAAPKSAGPTKWNEFLEKYIKNQAAKGRKITRLEAMSEAGPNYRRTYGLPEKKPKTARVANAVQVAPLETPAIPNTRRVTIMAPGNTAPITPGRLSPPVPLQTLNQALGSPLTTPSAVAAASATPLTPRNNAAFSPSAVPTTPLTPATANANVAAFSPPAAPTTPLTPAPPMTSRNNRNNRSRTNNNTRKNNNRDRTNNNKNRSAIPISPATYGYENEGYNTNAQVRKISVDGKQYFLGDDLSLFERDGDELQGWVGYLEPGGDIRYTNGPM